ncbi:restriction endonuclease subunit S [Pseudoalteromonas pernae]|uniref:restriction endonuclease subunit S n=1 Tax=Pseudoalteromonas pernae TaxID=3118054 RepID=UPI003242D7DD
MSALDQLIPKGYKTSEVGIIPERWNAVQAKEVVEFFGGYGFSSRLASNDGTKWLKIANVGINEIKWDAVSYLPDYLLKSFIDYSLAECDVVMALTRPLLGDQLKVAKIENKDLPAMLNQRVTKLKPKSNTNLNYIYYSIQREDFIAAMNLAMAGTDPPNIGTNALGKIFVALPENDKEQIAIANALSDVDALLTELEKLVTKKQAIKTATMQQLLTGKTRLPKFATYTEGEKQGQQKGTKPSELGEIPEDWDVKTIGESCDVLTGFPFPSNKYCDSGIRLLRGSNVKRGETDWSPEITQYWPEITPNIKEYELRVGDIVVSMDGSLVGKSYAQLSKEDLPAVLLQRVARIRSESIEVNYLKEWVCSKFFTNHCDSVKTVTAIPHISPLDIRSFRLLVPSEKEEQTAIATILSDMDSEIQTLEQRLAKTRQIKQGMMQELLTGRTRLPFEKD